MTNIWVNWLEAVRFTFEAQAVISARIMLFASGRPEAVAEAQRMISEKLSSFADAQLAAELALASGLGIQAAVERAYAPLRQCVRANSERLVHAAH